MDPEREQRVLPIIVPSGLRWLAQAKTLGNRHTLGRRWVEQAVQKQQRYRSLHALGRLHALSARLAGSEPGRPGWPALPRVDAPWPATLSAARLPGAAPVPLRRERAGGERREAGEDAARPPASLPSPHRPSPQQMPSAGLPPAGPDGEEETGRVPASVARRPASGLDPPVQRFLTQILDIRIPAVRLHVDQAADAVARRYRADAVVYGREILFRTDKYSPDTPQGLALLGHELTHVEQAASAAGERPPAADRHALAQWEAAALHNERRVLHHFAPTHTQGNPPAPPAPGAAAPPAPQGPAPAARPQTAASSRSLDLAGGTETTTAPALSERQLAQIKEMVYQDLMDRIRREFERGG